MTNSSPIPSTNIASATVTPPSGLAKRWIVLRLGSAKASSASFEVDGDVDVEDGRGGNRRYNRVSLFESEEDADIVNSCTRAGVERK